MAGQLNDAGDSAFWYTNAVTAPCNSSLTVLQFYLKYCISIIHLILIGVTENKGQALIQGWT